MTPTPTDQAPKLEAEAREWWNAHVAPLIGREWIGLVHRDRAASAYTAAFNAGANSMRQQVFELIKSLRHSGPRDPAVSEAVASVLFMLARELRALKVEL